MLPGVDAGGIRDGGEGVSVSERRAGILLTAAATCAGSSAAAVGRGATIADTAMR
jgi:hypothetical protein